MIVFTLIVLFLIDYLFVGLISLLLTGNRATNEYENLFRCAGSFLYNSRGKMTYFSGSLSLIGLKDDEIILGITKLSFHKKLSDIGKVQVKNYLLWKCLNVELKNGARAKIFCDTKQAKELESYLNKFIG